MPAPEFWRDRAELRGAVLSLIRELLGLFCCSIRASLAQLPSLSWFKTDQPCPASDTFVFPLNHCLPNHDGKCEEYIDDYLYLFLIHRFHLHFSHFLIFSSPLFPFSLSSLSLFAFQVEYDGLTGRVEFNSKGQRTNYTLRILEKHRGGHKEVRSHLLSCSSQVISPIGSELVTGHPSDFTTPGKAFNWAQPQHRLGWW